MCTRGLFGLHPEVNLPELVAVWTLSRPCLVETLDICLGQTGMASARRLKTSALDAVGTRHKHWQEGVSMGREVVLACYT